MYVSFSVMASGGVGGRDDATTFFLGKHMNSTLCEGVRLYIYLCSVGSQEAGVTAALWAGAELTAH